MIIPRLLVFGWVVSELTVGFFAVLVEEDAELDVAVVPPTLRETMVVTPAAMSATTMRATISCHVLSVIVLVCETEVFGAASLPEGFCWGMMFLH
jgi:hypothetical protein